MVTMHRRSFIAGSIALAVPASAAPKKKRKPGPAYVLIGDSMAYVMGPTFRQAAFAHGVRAGVWAKGGSSARQWLRKRWIEKAIHDFPDASCFLISLGVNCTRVERPKLADDISTIVTTFNDLMYAQDDEVRYEAPSAVWLLPPPLEMNTQYIHDAVAKSEVYAIDPGPLPLESDGVHPTIRGVTSWVSTIAQHLWT